MKNKIAKFSKSPLRHQNIKNPLQEYNLAESFYFSLCSNFKLIL